MWITFNARGDRPGEQVEVSIFVRNLNYGIAARCSRVNRRCNAIDMEPDNGPVLVAKHHSGDFAFG